MREHAGWVMFAFAVLGWMLTVVTQPDTDRAVAAEAHAVKLQATINAYPTPTSRPCQPYIYGVGYVGC